MEIVNKFQRTFDAIKNMAKRENYKRPHLMSPTTGYAVLVKDSKRHVHCVPSCEADNVQTDMLRFIYVKHPEADLIHTGFIYFADAEHGLGIERVTGDPDKAIERVKTCEGDIKAALEMFQFVSEAVTEN